MLTKEIINKNIPRLLLEDSVSKALRLVDDFRVTHLPIVSDGKFLGLISEEDLLDVEDVKIPIDLLQEHFIFASVQSNIHFLNAVSIILKYDTNLVAVVDSEGNYLGSITNFDLLKVLGNFAGAGDVGGIVVLQMEPNQYSISEISRIVESNDCTILHLNTMPDTSNVLLTVTIHLNKVEISSVISAFERYDYTIVYALGHEAYENVISDNYNNFMNYLDI